jgi:hypothetical protein
MRGGMGHPSQQLLTGIAEDKRSLAWRSPNTLPTMDQDQAFRIVT